LEFNSKKLLSEIRLERRRLFKRKFAAKNCLILTNFYRAYNEFTEAWGGCPVLNVGVDAKNNNLHITILQQKENHKIIEVKLL